MACAVVDDPEDPLGRGVGLGRHHLLDQAVEGVVADLFLAAPEQPSPAVVDVHRSQVGERAGATVLVFDQAGPPGGRRDEPMTPGHRLELGLLVGRYVVVAGVQAPALEAPLLEVEHAGGLGGELGVAREHSRGPRAGADRVLGQPPPDGRTRDRAADPALDGRLGELSARPARQRATRLGRQLAGERLDLGDLDGGKTTGTPRPRPLVESRKPLGGESSSPLRSGAVGAVEPGGDL